LLALTEVCVLADVSALTGFVFTLAEVSVLALTDASAARRAVCLAVDFTAAVVFTAALLALRLTLLVFACTLAWLVTPAFTDALDGERPSLCKAPVTSVDTFVDVPADAFVLFACAAVAVCRPKEALPAPAADLPALAALFTAVVAVVDAFVESVAAWPAVDAAEAATPACVAACAAVLAWLADWVAAVADELACVAALAAADACVAVLVVEFTIVPIWAFAFVVNKPATQRAAILSFVIFMIEAFKF
jgi:hypothetical protein